MCLQAKVSAPTRAGRALRRSLLKGCVVVIVVAGYSGKRFIYERAQELGIRWGAWSGQALCQTANTPAEGCTLLLIVKDCLGMRIILDGLLSRELAAHLLAPAPVFFYLWKHVLIQSGHYQSGLILVYSSGKQQSRVCFAHHRHTRDVQANVVFSQP